MTPEFWRGKRVFLTGHTGFKGGWLSLWLHGLGADVTGFALSPSGPSFFEVARVQEVTRSIIGDIRDAGTLSAAMRDASPEIVIHMAAQAIVLRGYEDPVETYSTNVMGLVNLFEAARNTPSVRTIVNVTSDKCYENREWVWGYRETEPMGGYDPYSNSKACAELVTSAYRQSYFSRAKEQGRSVAVGSGRAGNVIGGGDWAANRLVPDIMRSISAGEPVKIRNPSAIRPWQHVLEPLSGYLALAERLHEAGGNDYASGWNFGPSPDDVRPVSWIVEHLTSLWGQGARWTLDANLGPHEAHFLSLDCAKARAGLGWRAAWPLTRALEEIVTWHKAFLAGADMQNVSRTQIAAYQACLKV